MRVLAAATVLIVLAAGCVSDGGTTPTSSPTPSTPPKPAVVYGPKKIDLCASPAPQTVNEKPGDFQAGAAFDEILISFHVSGFGKAKLRVLDKDRSATLWESPGEDVNTLPGTLCGGHNHSGDAVAKPLVPGNYSVLLSYSGAIAIHADVTLKAAKTAANHTGHHDGA